MWLEVRMLMGGRWDDWWGHEGMLLGYWASSKEFVLISCKAVFTSVENLCSREAWCHIFTRFSNLGAVVCPVSSPLLWIQEKLLLFSFILVVRIEWWLPSYLYTEPKPRTAFLFFVLFLTQLMTLHLCLYNLIRVPCIYPPMILCHIDTWIDFCALLHTFVYFLPAVR